MFANNTRFRAYRVNTSDEIVVSASENVHREGGKIYRPHCATIYLSCRSTFNESIILFDTRKHVNFHVQSDYRCFLTTKYSEDNEFLRVKTKNRNLFITRSFLILILVCVLVRTHDIRWMWACSDVRKSRELFTWNQIELMSKAIKIFTPHKKFIGSKRSKKKIWRVFVIFTFFTFFTSFFIFNI